MAGFAAALGGAAKPLLDYGNQVREFAQQNRQLLSQRLADLADKESDPELRDKYRQGSIDLIGQKKDPATLFSSLIHAHAKSQKSGQEMGQIVHEGISSIPSAPPPPPSAGSGLPGGFTLQNIQRDPLPPSDARFGGISEPQDTPFGSLLAQAAPKPQPAPPVAAQPATAAVPTTAQPIQVPPSQPPAPTAIATQPAPMTGIEGLPVAENPTDIWNDITTRPIHAGGQPAWNAPANRPALMQEYQQRLTHQEALRQAMETKQTELAYKRQGIAEMKKSGEWEKLPGWMQSNFLAEASGLAAVPIGSSMNPHALTSGTLGSQAPPGTMEFGTNKPVDPKTLYDTKYIPGYDQTVWMPSAPKTGLTDTATGGRQLTNLQTGDAIAPAAGAVAPSQIAPIVGIGPNGAASVTSAAASAAGAPPVALAVTPAGLAPTEVKHTSVQLADGTTVTATESRKVALPGKAPVQGQTPVPAVKGVPRIPQNGDLPAMESVAPFNPSNRVDSLIQQIANGDTTLEKAKTNAHDKFQIETRMAQLGVTPANITTSMRDRAKNARLILTHLNDINLIIDQAEKDGDLGVVATRWNDFLTNKLGDDPTKTHVFSRLSSNLGFLSTAVSMAHGGMKGGSSPTMVEHWEKALDAKDPGTLRAKLGEAYKWMDGYSKLDQGLTDKPITGIATAPPITAVPGTNPSVVNDLIKQYAPKKP